MIEGKKWLVVLVALLGHVAEAIAGEQWRIPFAVTDSSARISFDIDSTWHLIHGVTSGLSGYIVQSSDGPRGALHIPVASFSTANAHRDERLREVMDAQHFPEVTFEIVAIKQLPAPESLVRDVPVAVVIEGVVAIHGVARPLTIPAEVIRTEQGVVLRGASSFGWSPFGVEDPSILVAKLDPMVQVSFEVRDLTIQREE